MAIYHFSGQMISRGKGQSATAAAAYRSGDKLHSERYNKTNEYKRIVQPESFMMKPKHAPEWANNREQLWNEVEKVENQKNAQLAREFNVALPVELSNEEQTKLAKKFVQEVFVDEGMVADLSIHRDDVNNPHFHVMLTTRGFKENGEWDAKASKVKLENGKQKRINKNNWGDRDTFRKWRKQWADYANQSLDQNDINETITHRSHESLNKETVPTIHEGYQARKMGDESDRVAVNKQVKRHNDKVQLLNEYKQEKQKLEKSEQLSRSFSPKEKKEISKSAKSLKMFVSFRNINEKEKMLARWKHSTLTKNGQSDNRETLQKIKSIKDKLEVVDNILNKEANRFIEKHYPALSKEMYNDFSAKYLVDVSVKENKIFDQDETMKILKEGQQEEVNHELSKLVQNRHYSYETLITRKDQLTNQFEALLLKYRVDFNKPRTFERLTPEVQNDIRSTHETLQSTKHAVNFLETYYNDQITRMYDQDVSKQMTINEKELVVGYNEYFNKTVPLNGEGHPSEIFKFSTDEKAQIIDLLHDYQNGHLNTEADTETRFADILSGSASIQHYFIAECLETKDFDADTKSKLEDILSSYEGKHQDYISFNDTRQMTSLSSMVQATQNIVENSLKQADYDEREKLQEMNRLQSQRKRKGLR
ncbi:MULTISPECIES: MobQ family relaxase [Halobacillus]|uniref:MobQ family relaxase n=1 Tax=Halobacillus TaxID=45667 RepID=UPI0013D4B58E|nr:MULTISPECIES: MobQ family relaxase [Halobacillus]